MNSSVPKGPSRAQGSGTSLGGLSGVLQLLPTRKSVLEAAPPHPSLVSARDLTSCFSLHFCWVLLFQSVQLRSSLEPQEKKGHHGSWHIFELNTEFLKENLSSQPSHLRHCWQESPGPSKALDSCCPGSKRKRFTGHRSPRRLQVTSSLGCLSGGSLAFL